MTCILNRLIRYERRKWVSGALKEGGSGLGRIHSVNGYTYTYDGDGFRVAKSNGSSGTIYWPDVKGRIQAETDLSGNSATRTVYMGRTQVAVADSSGNWSYFLHDHLGSTRMSLDAVGNVIDDVDYFPFGGIAYGAGSWATDQLFAGYLYDGESETNYEMARNTSPSLGRFNRPDPYYGSYDMGDPQSLNRYSYVGNGPLIHVDPNGLAYTICTTDGTCTTYLNTQWDQLTGGFSGDPNNSVGSDGTIWSNVNGVWVATGSVSYTPDPTPNTTISSQQGTTPQGGGGGRHYVQSTTPYCNDTSSGAGTFKNYADSDIKAAGEASGLSVLFPWAAEVLLPSAAIFAASGTLEELISSGDKLLFKIRVPSVTAFTTFIDQYVFLGEDALSCLTIPRLRRLPILLLLSCSVCQLLNMECPHTGIGTPSASTLGAMSKPLFRFRYVLQFLLLFHVHGGLLH